MREICMQQKGKALTAHRGETTKTTCFTHHCSCRCPLPPHWPSSSADPCPHHPHCHHQVVLARQSSHLDQAPAQHRKGDNKRMRAEARTSASAASVEVATSAFVEQKQLTRLSRRPDKQERFVIIIKTKRDTLHIRVQTPDLNMCFTRAHHRK